MRTQLLELGPLRALPSWKSCQRDKRMPRPAAPAPVLCRSCFLESHGGPPLRCIAIKPDGIVCALQQSFQHLPAPSAHLYSGDAIVSQIEVQNEEPASRRSGCAPAPSNPRGLLRPIVRLFAPYSTTGLENSLRVRCLLRWVTPSLDRPAAGLALSGKAPRTKACRVCRRTKPR